MFTQPFKLLNQRYSWWVDLVFLTIIFSGLFFFLLGDRPLFVPDEGRYAEIAREMVASGNYITPYLNGIKYFEKPILFYWLEAAAIHLNGPALWSIRSVNALLALFGCLLTYFTARKLYDRSTGLLSAFILATSMLYFAMAHMINLDLTVTVWLSAALYTFLLASREPRPLPRRFYMWGAASAAALAVLTKGLIGIVFPCLIIGTWLCLTAEWRLLKRLYLISSVLLFFLIASPWHFIVNWYNPEFFHFYFIEQHLLRYTTPNIGHYQPAWFFIPCLMLGFFPWIVFLPSALTAHCIAIWHDRRHHAATLFLFLWVVLIFAFFSFSQSKLVPYILPLFPPLAILTARYLSEQIAKKEVKTRKFFSIRLLVGYFILALFALAMMALFHSFVSHHSLPDSMMAGSRLNLAATIFLISALMSGFYTYRQAFYRALSTTVVGTSLFLLALLSSLPALDTRSVLPLARILTPLLQPADEVITYHQYYQDLPFYLERRVSIVDWKNELSYGMQHQDTHEWMINDNIFWQRWHSPRTVYVILGLDEFAHLHRDHPDDKFYILGKSVNNILVTNHSTGVKTMPPLDLLSH